MSKATSAPKKKGKGCGCAIAVVVLLLLVVGGVLAAVRFGMLKLPVNIPGITPSGRPSPSLYGETNLYASDAEVDAPAEAEQPPAEPEPEPEVRDAARTAEPIIDEEQGARRLARTWNAMRPEDLVKLVERGWTDEELARVLLHMDPQSVGRLLTAMNPDQASRVSRELQAQASVVRPEAEGP